MSELTRGQQFRIANINHAKRLLSAIPDANEATQIATLMVNLGVTRTKAVEYRELVSNVG